MRTKDYLYFGLLAVFAEWLGLISSLAYLGHFNPNLALSTASVALWPVPLIFGLTLTFAGIGYALFSLALRSYSKLIPYYALVAGIAFSLTGWISYTGKGGTKDLMHQLCSYIALFGYVAMIWLLHHHPQRQISLSSKVIAGLITAAVILAIPSDYVLHRYFAYVQLMILGLIQSWTLLVIWYERKTRPTGQAGLTEVE